MSLFDLPSRVGRLVLASGSPRRVQLLREAGFDPQVMPQDVDETPLPGEKAYDLVDRLASLKAHAALAQARPGDLILAADTTVALEGEELGKPADEAEARQMLRRLSGRGHDVYAAVHLILVGEDGSTRESSTCELTHVTFFDLAEDEIESYVATGEPLDKAGAYGIQGIGRALVRDIDGDYFNVVGLPVARTLRVIDDLMGK
ncbi:Maf family protein [Parolsenella catena]|uniref:Maf family protein n=1 Tax=Parolsenella catena TaxID=2003188 RepID=UPI00189819EF|nr:Maf family protein [Parolsenella catena]